MPPLKKHATRFEPLNIDDLAVKRICELEHLYFTRYFFKQRQGISFLLNWHHMLICDVVEDVIAGRRKNVWINVAPGGTKTELVVINLIARGLAINPRARFLHLSYSDDLALQNSQAAREIITSDEYQRLWPMKIADDSRAKKRWNVMMNGKKAGGVYATSLGGQITGFRAGHMAPGFQGALIIDDPIKPEDAFNKTIVDKANRKLISTVKSRLANPDIPIIGIMQRVAEMDPTGFCEAGNLGKDWTFVTIPAVIDDAYVATLPEKYQKLIVRDAEGRFSYWPYKERIGDLLAMERGEGTDASGSRISRHVFSSQYQQAPKAVGGNIIHGSWFERYTLLPKIKYRNIYADTAQKTKERNDYSVLQCWGFGEDGKIYLLDQLRGKWEAPELETRVKEFWAKHKLLTAVPEWASLPPAAEGKVGQLRYLKVEDKASGTGLIQKIRVSPQLHIPVKDIQRSIDKLTRVMDGAPYMSAHLVCIPENAPFTNDFVSECEAFTADDSHAFDDQIDPMLDAIKDLLSSENKLEKWRKLI